MFPDTRKLVYEPLLKRRADAPPIRESIERIWHSFYEIDVQFIYRQKTEQSMRR